MKGKANLNIIASIDSVKYINNIIFVPQKATVKEYLSFNIN